MELEVCEGDIAEVEADAIANAANDHLWMGAGVAGALKRAGGDELVRTTTRSCLDVADELGCRSLALPAFGTGVGGFPLDECARIMVGEAQAFEPRSLEYVLFAVRGQDAETAFQAALAA